MKTLLSLLLFTLLITPAAGMGTNTSVEDVLMCYTMTENGRLASLAVESVASTVASTQLGHTGVDTLSALAFRPTSAILYGVHAGQLGVVDTTTGGFIALPGIGIGSGVGSLGTQAFSDVRGMTFDPFTAELFASVYTGAGNVLIRIDPATGAAVSGAFGSGADYLPIQTAAGVQIGAIAISPFDGRLYGVAAGNDGIHRIGAH